MSLSDYSISEYRDAEFLEHLFPLKKKVSNVAFDSASETANLPTFNPDVRVTVTEPRRSKRDVESKRISDLTLSLLS